MLVAPQSASAFAYVGGGGLAGWRALSKGLDGRLERFAEEPAIAREMAYFEARIGEVGTAEELVADQRLFEFALLAYDLEGQEGSQALMRRALSEDLADPGATANRLVDPRYRTMAAAFGFGGNAGGTDARTLDRAVEGYLRGTYEVRTGEKLPTVTTARQDELLAAIAAEPAVEAEIAWFRGSLADAADPEAVAKDHRLTAFAYRAAGFPGRLALDDDLVRRAIEDPESLTADERATASARRAAGFAGAPALDDDLIRRAIAEPETRDALGDARWDAFAATFAHAAEGRPLRLGGAAAQVDALVDRWVGASFTLETGRQVAGTPSPALEADLAAFAGRDEVKEAVQRFRQEIAGVSGAAGLLAKPHAYKFALRAFGLDAFQKNPDIVLRTLALPPSSRLSPAAHDPRLEAFAKGLGFLSGRGSAAAGDPAFLEEVKARYVRVQFERAVGANDLGARQALYAQRALPKVTSPYQIIGDLPLRQFVFPAVGLPANSALDVDRLARLLEDRLEMGRLDEPAYFAKLADRFFASSAATSGVGAASPVVALLGGGGGTGFGFGLDLLLQVQQFRR